VTGTDQIGHKAAVLVQFGVGLGDGVLALLHRRHIDDLVGHLPIHDAAVRAFDEAVLVDAGEGRQAVDQADVRAFRRFNGADAAVVRGVHVAHLKAGALARQTTRPQGRQAPLVRHLRQRVGLVHELRQLGRAEELAHRRRRRLGVDQVVRHDGVDVHGAHALADGAFHAQQTDAVLVLHQLANRADTAVAEVVDIVHLAAAVFHLHQQADDLHDIRLAQHPHGVRHVIIGEAQAGVHLDAADRRQVIALGIEEQALEQRVGGFQGRRLARAHDAIDVDQRLFPRGILVDRERVADVRPDVDVVDVQDLQLGHAGLFHLGQHVLGQLITGLGEDLTGLLVDHVLGGVPAHQLLGEHTLAGHALLDQLAGRARRDLGARLHLDLAGVGVDQIVHQLDAAHPVRLKRNLPALLVAREGQGIVVVVEDLLGRHALDLEQVHALVLGRALGPQRLCRTSLQRVQQGRHRQLAAPVDAHIDEILGVELEVQPRAAIRDHAGGEQELAGRVRLAFVVVEEHAGRAVHLRDDDALGAVDDEGAVGRHQRHVAHVDVLLLDVADGAGTRLLVHVPDEQAQRHLERRGEGHAALLALVDVILGRLQVIADEFQFPLAGKVADGEHGLQHLLKAAVGAFGGRQANLEELIVAAFLHLDQVGHGGHGGDTPKVLADPPPTCQRLGHCRSLPAVLPNVRVAPVAPGRFPFPRPLWSWASSCCLGRRNTRVDPASARLPIRMPTPQTPESRGDTRRPPGPRTILNRYTHARLTSPRRWRRPLPASSSAPRPRPWARLPSRASARLRPVPWLPSGPGR